MSGYHGRLNFEAWVDRQQAKRRAKYQWASAFAMAAWITGVLILWAIVAGNQSRGAEPQKSIPHAGVAVSTAIVKARIDARPELDDDLAQAPGAEADGAGVESQPEPVADIKRFVHRISRHGNGVTSGGSAVCLGGEKFLTNAHVVESGGYVSLDGKGVRATVQILSPSQQHDLALVTVRGNTDEGVELSTDWSEHLAVATVIGFPGDSETARVTSGVVSDFDTVALGNDQPPVARGMSGGAVFVDGKLVGILRGYSGNRGVPENPRAAKFTALAQVATLVAALTAAPQPAASTPVTPPQQRTGHWERRCFGSYCQNVWVWDN
jgi:hypothetical protein